MSSALLRPLSRPVSATIAVPGSKSIANRALVCAMLAAGDSEISHVPFGDDTQVIVNVLQQMGAVRSGSGGELVVHGDSARALPGIIDAQLAGTSSRFLTAVAALSPSTVLVDGEPALRSRPMRDLHQALQALGAVVTSLGDEGHLPVSVSRGDCTGGHITIKGDTSSQFISALMLIAPVLENGLIIDIDGPLVSHSYVTMTMSVMSKFGANVRMSEKQISIEPTGYRAQEYVIEPDFSSAAFPLVATGIAGGEVTVSHLLSESVQGDAAIIGILSKMGLVIQETVQGIHVSRDSNVRLQSLQMNMADCSDLVPAVAVLCSVAQGTSELSGIGFIRNKESNRIADLAHELNKCGARVSEMEDGLRIEGVPQLKPATFETHHDHRLAMSLALTSLSSGECEVKDFQVVSKSWPTYFDDMSQILGPLQKRN